VKVKGNDMVTTSALDHVGDKLCGNRCAGFVLLVLASVGEVGHNSGDSTSGGGLTGLDNDQELHKVVVEVVTRAGGLENEDVFVADGLAHDYGGFLVGVFEDGHIEELDTQAVRENQNSIQKKSRSPSLTKCATSMTCDSAARQLPKKFDIRKRKTHRSATRCANAGCELPVRSLIELEDIPGVVAAVC
jgi:hypothetical protein